MLPLIFMRVRRLRVAYEERQTRVYELSRVCVQSEPVLPPCSIDAELDPQPILSSFTTERLPLQPPPIITILYCNYSSLFNYLDRQPECSFCRCLFLGKREPPRLQVCSEEFLIRHFSGNFRRALYYYCWIQITRPH